MKIYSEKSLSDFNFWSGAENKANCLTNKELNQIEFILDDLYPEGITDTQLNDLFWHDFETVCEWIGTTVEEVFEREDE